MALFSTWPGRKEAGRLPEHVDRSQIPSNRAAGWSPGRLPPPTSPFRGMRSAIPCPPLNVPKPCGDPVRAGEVRFALGKETPDHPWARGPSDSGTEITCPECRIRYVRLPAREVQKAPEDDQEWQYVCLVEREEVEAREKATLAEREARALRAKLKRELLKEAIRTLTHAGQMRHAMAAEIFGFAGADEAKDFAARRHLKTWTRDATESHRLQNIAAYFGRAEQLSAAEKKCAETAAASRELGLPPAAYALRQKSMAALLRES